MRENVTELWMATPRFHFMKKAVQMAMAATPTNSL